MSISSTSSKSLSSIFDLPTTGLRFFTVYGPWGRPDMALFLFAEAMLKDEPINVFNHGNMVRDFTYVDDIVESITRLVVKPAKTNIDWKSYYQYFLIQSLCSPNYHSNHGNEKGYKRQGTTNQQKQK